VHDYALHIPTATSVKSEKLLHYADGFIAELMPFAERWCDIGRFLKVSGAILLWLGNMKSDEERLKGLIYYYSSRHVFTQEDVVAVLRGIEETEAAGQIIRTKPVNGNCAY